MHKLLQIQVGCTVQSDVSDRKVEITAHPYHINLSVTHFGDLVSIYGPEIMRTVPYDYHLCITAGKLRPNILFGCMRPDDECEYNWPAMIPLRISRYYLTSTLFSLGLVGSNTLVSQCDDAVDRLNAMRSGGSRFSAIAGDEVKLVVCDNTPPVKPIGARDITIDMVQATHDLNVMMLFNRWPKGSGNIRLIGASVGVQLLKLSTIFDCITVGGIAFNTSHRDPIEFQDQLIEAGLSQFARN